MNEDRSPLERSLAALNAYLFAGRVLSDTLDEIIRRALDTLPAAKFIAMIVAMNGTPHTPVATDRLAVELDEVQYAADRGPCLDSFRDGELYIIDDTRTDQRWPEFCRAAAERGVLSTMSLPLAAANVHLGAMNVYAMAPGSFGEAESSAGSVFATQASILLANAQAYHDAQTLSENLNEAMKSRAVIEQAKGIIIGATRCTPDEAFDQLRKQSQDMNTKLRDVAAEIVKNAQRPA